MVGSVLHELYAICILTWSKVLNAAEKTKSSISWTLATAMEAITPRNSPFPNSILPLRSTSNLFTRSSTCPGWESYLRHLRPTVSLGATLPRAESTLDSSPTSMVPSLKAHNANACPLLYRYRVIFLTAPPLQKNKIKVCKTKVSWVYVDVDCPRYT